MRCSHCSRLLMFGFSTRPTRLSVSLGRQEGELCVVRRWAGLDDLPGLGSGTVDFNANCYPSDTSNNNTLPANAARCARIFPGIMTTSYTVSNVAAPNLDFLITVSAGNCRFTFQRDSVTRRFDYDPATGRVLNVLNP